jgi:hypothetical protein
MNADENSRFRLAACLIIEIFHHKLEPNLDMILANLPNELYGIYDRFLETFEGEDLVYLERILRWLLFSAEPLTLPELSHSTSQTRTYMYTTHLNGATKPQFLLDFWKGSSL